MSSSTVSRWSWILLSGLVWLFSAQSASAFTYTWSAQSDKEQLVLSFEGAVPAYGLERTGTTELTLALPPDYWVAHGRPLPQEFSQSKLIASMDITDEGARITLRTNGFGYVYFAETGRIILDVFADPIGSRWEPSMAAVPTPGDGPAPQPESEPEDQDVPQPAVAEESPAMPEEMAGEVTLPEPRETEEPVQPVPAQPGIAQPGIAEPEPAEQPDLQEPSHVLRAPFRMVGPDEAGPVEQPEQAVPETQETPEMVAAVPPVEPEAAVRQPITLEPTTPEPETVAQPEPETVEPETAVLPEPETIALPEPETAAPTRPETMADDSTPPHEVRRPFLNITIEEAEAMAQEERPPDQIAQPDTPGLPDMPEVAEQPAQPETPESPGVTEQPAQVDVAESGETPGDVQVVTPEDLAEGEPQPDNLNDVLTEAAAAMASGDYVVVVEQLRGIMMSPRLDDFMRERATYLLANARFALARDEGNLEETYDTITRLYDEAISISKSLTAIHGEPSPNSNEIPNALLNQGLLNLRVDNFTRAEAYFNILRRDYPDHPNIPTIYYYLGEYYQKKELYQEAADNYDIVVQKYPDHQMVKPAALGLALALDKLGYIAQAAEIMDFIEQRWPRSYEEDPTLLTVAGSIYFKNNTLDKARDRYWTYYNIIPTAPDADIVLARLGDIYLRTDPPLTEAATEVYTRAASLYPDSEGGLISQMRLAENGVLDSPTIEQMFTVFDRPFTSTPEAVYTKIVTEYPDSMLAPLAQLKLAMWHLYHGETTRTINAANMFAQRYAQSPLMPNAQATAMEAFSQTVDALLPQGDYMPLVDLWGKNAILYDQEENLEPSDRIALAMSYWKAGYPDWALHLTDALFRRQGMPEHSEEALTLALNIMLDTQDWEGIKTLAERVEQWELSPTAERELTYVRALAYENLNQPELSRPLWTRLSGYTDSEPSVRAYTFYFLALESHERMELKKAYDYAQASLSLFQELDIDKNKVKDLLLLLADITETSDRTQEALKWTQEFAAYVNEEDPGWPALRYRMARLYRKAAETGKWREILEDLSTRMPNTLYGRMAASDLETYNLEIKAREFVPQSSI